MKKILIFAALLCSGPASAGSDKWNRVGATVDEDGAGASTKARGLAAL